MSADNWAICPRCLVEFNKANEKLKLDAGAAYGKVEPQEYLRMLAEAEGASKRETKREFREDYWIGVDAGGTFEVSYRGSCNSCGLSFDYQFTAPVDLNAPPPPTAAKKGRAK